MPREYSKLLRLYKLCTGYIYYAHGIGTMHIVSSSMYYMQCSYTMYMINTLYIVYTLTTTICHHFSRKTTLSMLIKLTHKLTIICPVPH